jgi:hypothetical protein
MWKITFTEQHANGLRTGPHTVFEDARNYGEAVEKFTGFCARAGQNVEIVDCKSSARSWCD